MCCSRADAREVQGLRRASRRRATRDNGGITYYQVQATGARELQNPHDFNVSSTSYLKHKSDRWCRSQAEEHRLSAPNMDGHSRHTGRN